MARRLMANAPAVAPMEPMKAECIPCLEDAGLWYFAEQVRTGHPVYEYEVKAALDETGGRERLYGSPYADSCFPGVIGPIENSEGTNSVAAMMSEGCPPNTGRTYEEV